MTLTNETKVLAGVLAGTLVLIVGGAFLAGDEKPEPETVVTETERLVREDDPFVGPADAKVTLVEFSDFYCPSCKAVQPLMEQLKEQNKDKSVRFVFRNFVLAPSMSDERALPAHAAVASQQQGKFWEYHDLLFENQPNLGKDNLLKQAEQMGLDKGALEQAMGSDEVKDAVRQDKADGTALGIRGTPTFFINGVQYQGQYTAEGFQEAIDEALSN